MMPEPAQDTRRVILADIPKDSHSSAQITSSTGNKQRATSGGYPNPSILDQLVQGRIAAYYDVHRAPGLKASAHSKRLIVKTPSPTLGNIERCRRKEDLGDAARAEKAEANWSNAQTV